MYYGCSVESYHGVVVAVDHDWPAPSQVDVLFPPITDLVPVNTGGFRYRLPQLLLLPDHSDMPTWPVVFAPFKTFVIISI